jgi:anti-sigma factor RsiW
MDCQNIEHWVLLEDGEKSVNESRRLREHLATCARCARRHQKALDWIEQWSAPVGALSAEVAAQRVLERLDQRAASAATSAPRIGAAARGPSESRRLVLPLRRPWGPAIAWASGALSAAAVALSVANGFGGADEKDQRAGVEFGARGAEADEAASLRRSVGFSFHVVHDMRPLRAGDALEAGDAIVGGYINLGTAQPVYALSFAVDDGGEVHWLYPAYLDVNDDPEAVPLPPTQSVEVLMAEAVVVDAPAGRFSILTITSYERLRVGQIEALPAATLTPEGLRQVLGAVQVSELELQLR